MKKETKIYESPLLDVVFLKTEGVLCGSDFGESGVEGSTVKNPSWDWSSDEE